MSANSVSSAQQSITPKHTSLNINDKFEFIGISYKNKQVVVNDEKWKLFEYLLMKNTFLMLQHKISFYTEKKKTTEDSITVIDTQSNSTKIGKSSSPEIKKKMDESLAETNYKLLLESNKYGSILNFIEKNIMSEKMHGITLQTLLKTIAKIKSDPNYIDQETYRKYLDSFLPEKRQRNKKGKKTFAKEYSEQYVEGGDFTKEKTRSELINDYWGRLTEDQKILIKNKGKEQEFKKFLERHITRPPKNITNNKNTRTQYSFDQTKVEELAKTFLNKIKNTKPPKKKV